MNLRVLRLAASDNPRSADNEQERLLRVVSSAWQNPQRLNARQLSFMPRLMLKIKSELYGDMQRVAEMSIPHRSNQKPETRNRKRSMGHGHGGKQGK